jgi:hypothetical protein
LQRETGTSSEQLSAASFILSQQEVKALMASCRDQALELVPLAFESITRRFGSRKESEWLAVEILKKVVQVFMVKPIFIIWSTSCKK